MQTIHDFVEYLNGCDLSNWREIYDIYIAAKTKESQTFYNISFSKSDDSFFIESNHDMDYRLRVASPKAQQELLRVIQVSYMDEMDVESYFGYNMALENSRDSD